jgi:ICP0-binding domain of Ubiquitin-specific protease 7
MRRYYFGRSDFFGLRFAKNAVNMTQEIKPTMIEALKPKQSLKAAELQDGDIVCFQRISEKKGDKNILEKKFGLGENRVSMEETLVKLFALGNTKLTCPAREKRKSSRTQKSTTISSTIRESFNSALTRRDAIHRCILRSNSF